KPLWLFSPYTSRAYFVLRRPLSATLFPYTTLFRSRTARATAGDHGRAFSVVDACGRTGSKFVAFAADCRHRRRRCRVPAGAERHQHASASRSCSPPDDRFNSGKQGMAQEPADIRETRLTRIDPASARQQIKRRDEGGHADRNRSLDE